MKVLLTGASGFVGSHILDCLCRQNIPTAVLLRSSSNRQFLAHHLPEIEVRSGGLSQPASLEQALEGVTHVIHCAGATKAVRSAEFYESNHLGTRNLLEAVNRRPDAIERFVHISSLAVAGPATAAQPARESAPPRPISHYGHSKLAAELEVRTRCRVTATILRPPAVYGPRDDGFLPMFRAVKNHLLPQPSATQALSLVFAKDLAEAVVLCLRHPGAGGKTYFVAGRETVTGREMAGLIAAQMKTWTIPCPLPAAVLWPVCLAQEVLARLTRKPTLLNLQKFQELRAPGWVCDPSLFERDLGFACPTPLAAGLAETLAWYREQKWL